MYMVVGAEVGCGCDGGKIFGREGIKHYYFILEIGGSIPETSYTNDNRDPHMFLFWFDLSILGQKSSPIIN